MSEHADLLVEIGTEELPPAALQRLARAFADGVESGLAQAQIAPREVAAYATPRRLAVHARAVPTRQPDREVERWGPPVDQAFDADGKPTRAAEGFAAAAGARVDQLERLDSPKGKRLFFKWTEPGQSAGEVVPGIVRAALDRLPVPRRMRWGAGEVTFVRPVHWVVMLLGETAIDAEILGLTAGRTTFGHRFHAPRGIALGCPDEYSDRLEREGWVIADPERRRERIREEVVAAARGAGGEAVIEPAILDEVTALVEWPVALAGTFDERYLALPKEVLVASMTGHQRVFPVEDAEGRLRPAFVAVANIDSREPGQVRHGNERVIRPRLADAEFFWKQDRRRPLADRLGPLADMVFQERLGSLYDKTRRVEALAGELADAFGAEHGDAARAARLAKCDLLTDMVGEFPELQGIMGRYYALADGEPASVADALAEQYKPRFAGDAIAASPPGRALAVADRLDTLAGIFAVGQGPSGDKDPFALRRAALGVVRTIIESRADVDLHAALQRAGERLPSGIVDAAKLADEVFDFTMERLRGYYEEQGIPGDVYEAVAAGHPSRPFDFDRRVHAVARFRERPEAEALAAANKRIHNILRQAGDATRASAADGDGAEPAERTLVERVRALEDELPPRLEAGEYVETMERLAALHEPVDAFFDQVMVMAEDPDTRAARVALLRRLQDLFMRVADISLLRQ